MARETSGDFSHAPDFFASGSHASKTAKRGAASVVVVPAKTARRVQGAGPPLTFFACRYYHDLGWPTFRDFRQVAAAGLDLLFFLSLPSARET